MKYVLSKRTRIFFECILLAACIFLFLATRFNSFEFPATWIILLSLIITYFSYRLYKYRFVEYDENNLYLSDIANTKTVVPLGSIISIKTTGMHIKPSL